MSDDNISDEERMRRLTACRNVIHTLVNKKMPKPEPIDEKQISGKPLTSVERYQLYLEEHREVLLESLKNLEAQKNMDPQGIKE